MLKNARSLFFIGIGGINMSSLAHISALMGYKVAGSDRTETALTRSLEAAGIEIHYCHDAANVGDADAVIYTVAISEDNPEYRYADSLGIPCISRADYLGYLMTKYQTRIGISGMHGKSTTTSMTALAFSHANGDPTVLCGAEMKEFDGAYTIGESDNFIFEACEYMDSFLDFNPSIAVILNIEMDHVDYFKSMAQIRRSFASFAAITGEDGTVIANIDDENVRLALKGTPGRVVGISTCSPDADYCAVNVTTVGGRFAFDVMHEATAIAHIELSVPGHHNIYNALAAFAAADICGLDRALAAEGISSFRGAGRRMDYKGKFEGAEVYDDYGHHPTEVRVTLEGFKNIAFGRVWCVFQPHTYSRTAALAGDFSDALAVADKSLLIDIYAAREINTFGISSKDIADKIALSGGDSRYAGSLSSAVEILRREAREGDVIVIMGAGDIYRIFPLMGFDA